MKKLTMWGGALALILGVGFAHALFEVCFDVLARAGSTDKKAIAAAAAQMAVEAAAELAQRSNVKAARPAGAPFPTPDAEEPAQSPRSAALARRYAEATAASSRSILAVA